MPVKDKRKKQKRAGKVSGIRQVQHLGKGSREREEMGEEMGKESLRV